MIKNDILREFKAMQEIGLRVPKKAYALLEIEDLDQYDNMSVFDVAHLIIELSEVMA
jgi:hypothetical protein